MSRILKRPMFRKGGPAMEGVMNGIEDRTNFNTGDLVKKAQQRKKLLETLVKQPSPGSALTNFLLQFGPAIATRPATGNIFTDVLGAAQAPAANLAKQRAAEDQFQRQLGLVAAKSVIDPVTGKIFEAQTKEGRTRDLFKQITSQYDPNRSAGAVVVARAKVIADRTYDAEQSNSKYTITNPDLRNAFRVRGKSVEANPDFYPKEVRIGDYYYNPFLGNYIRRVDNTGDVNKDFVPVDKAGERLTKGD